MRDHTQRQPLSHTHRVRSVEKNVFSEIDFGALAERGKLVCYAPECVVSSSERTSLRDDDLGRSVRGEVGEQQLVGLLSAD
eukprot:1960372-Pleurochrysis_carterae.AAC.1